MKQSALEPEPVLQAEIERLVAALPSLPAVVRYFDDFDNEMRSLRLLASTDFLSVRIDGLNHTRFAA